VGRVRGDRRLLLFLLAVFVRTMMLFSTLTFMPVARVLRRIARLVGRGAS